jgi:hypothetical protein
VNCVAMLSSQNISFLSIMPGPRPGKGPRGEQLDLALRSICWEYKQTNHNCRWSLRFFQLGKNALSHSVEVSVRFLRVGTASWSGLWDSVCNHSFSGCN